MALTRYFDGFGAFTRFLEAAAVRAVPVVDMAAILAEKTLYKKARAIFGDNAKLADLADATQQDRVAKGYSPNEPLLRDGTLLRDRVESGHDGGLAGIGSSEPVMLYHETGYYNVRAGRMVPPRPVFQIALQESMPEVEKIAELSVGEILGATPTLSIDEG